jgi:hypothetical protein
MSAYSIEIIYYPGQNHEDDFILNGVVAHEIKDGFLRADLAENPKGEVAVAINLRNVQMMIEGPLT